MGSAPVVSKNFKLALFHQVLSEFNSHKIDLCKGDPKIVQVN